MAAALQVDGLSKSYLISHRAREPYRTLRDAVSRSARNAALALTGRPRPGAETPPGAAPPNARAPARAFVRPDVARCFAGYAAMTLVRAGARASVNSASARTLSAAQKIHVVP